MELAKESYTEPTLVSHDLLMDITGVVSGIKFTDKTGKEQDGNSF